MFRVRATLSNKRAMKKKICIKLPHEIGTSSANYSTVYTHANAQLAVYVRQIFGSHTHTHTPFTIASHLIAIRHTARIVYANIKVNQNNFWLVKSLCVQCSHTRARASLSIRIDVFVCVCVLCSVYTVHAQTTLLSKKSDISHSVKREKK